MGEAGFSTGADQVHQNRVTEWLHGREPPQAADLAMLGVNGSVREYPDPCRATLY